MFILSISKTLSPGEFLENAPWCLKIDNFKLGQIEKIVSFSKRGSLTENNGSITSAQLLIVMEKFKFFKNFKNEIANVIFRTIFNESEIFFWSIAQIERGFQIRDLHHFASKNVPHTISQILRVTEI